MGLDPVPRPLPSGADSIHRRPTRAPARGRRAEMSSHPDEPRDRDEPQGTEHQADDEQSAGLTEEFEAEFGEEFGADVADELAPEEEAAAPDEEGEPEADAEPGADVESEPDGADP